MITLIANAKINLFLDITDKRPDGYHNLESVMQSVDLSDIITLELSDKITVECSNPEIPQNDGNICYKAAELFYGESGQKGGAEIHIEKRIPHGAGLGGGSADAAAVLTGLNKLNENPFSAAELSRIGAKIGADVPFCLRGGIQVCRGIGDEMMEIPMLPKRVFLVVKPDFACDTRHGYAKYDKSPISKCGKMSEFLESGEKFPEMMYNVFQIVYNDKRINGILKRLNDSGAEGEILTGSGSAVFGVFTDENSARAAAREFPKYFTAVCKPVSKGIITIDSLARYKKN